MAKFCMNCGNPIDEGAAFCDNCGAKVDAPQENQPAQQPAQTYGGSYTQSPQQTQQQYIPASQPGQQYPQYGNQQPPKKKKTGLIIGLSIAGVIAVTAIVAIAVLMASLMKPHKNDPLPSQTEFVTEQATAEITEAATEAITEAPTEAPTQKPTEVPTEAPTEAPAKLPYADSIGKPAATDFTWIADAQSGNLTGSFLGNDDLVGKWKGEIIYDGAWELVYVTIDRDAKIVIEPCQINYGDGWEDESGEEPYVFKGAFEISSVNGAGSYGSINLYTFLESNGTQYAVGTFSVNNTSSADIYMVRP